MRAPRWCRAARSSSPPRSISACAIWHRRSPSSSPRTPRYGSTCRSPTASWTSWKKASTWRCASAAPGSEHIVARKLGETRLVPCASPAYLAAHGAPQTPEDLARHNCFTYEYVTPTEPLALPRRGRRPSARCACAAACTRNNGDLLAEAAAQGAGIVFEPAFIVGPDVRAGRLVPLLQDYEPAPVPIYAVYPSRKHLSAKVRLFVDFLRRALRATRRTGARREAALACCCAARCAAVASRRARARCPTGSSPRPTAGPRAGAALRAHRGRHRRARRCPTSCEVRLKRGRRRAHRHADGGRPAAAERSASTPATMPAGSPGRCRVELVGRRSSVLLLAVDRHARTRCTRSPARRRPGDYEPPLSENDPMYFVVGARDGWTARFQLSFKYRLFDPASGFGRDQPWLSGFYFGYTQNSLWDLSSESQGRSATPATGRSLFWSWERTDDKTWIDGVRARASSTSRTAATATRSRSINIAVPAAGVALAARATAAASSSRRSSTATSTRRRTRTSSSTAATSTGGCATTRPATGSRPPWRASAPRARAACSSTSRSASRDLKFGPVGGYLHVQYLHRLRRGHPRLQRAAKIAAPDRIRDRAVRTADS